MLAESGRDNPSMAEKADGSNGTIVPFVTSDDSRRDSLPVAQHLFKCKNILISRVGLKSYNLQEIQLSECT